MTGDERESLIRRAAEVEAMAADLPSPCVSICRMDAQRATCLGCLRTIDEIAGWRGQDDPAKRRIWRAIAERALSADPAHPEAVLP